jgi:tRNA-splicing ligase RtcB
MKESQPEGGPLCHTIGGGRIPILSWCPSIEQAALLQVRNLAEHPMVFHHVAIMPDCHVGFGMPVGGVIACEEAIIPNAIGVDIGCGMAAARTSIPAGSLSRDAVAKILAAMAERIPVGEGNARKDPCRFPESLLLPGWLDRRGSDLAFRNLGTLGGGNHFIEVQSGSDGRTWLMVHTGSRNLGLRIARHHNEIAIRMQKRTGTAPPDLAFLPADTDEGRLYITEMGTALEYAAENRRLVMRDVMTAFEEAAGASEFDRSISIHHNYASLEEHFGRKVWIHRKGATSAFREQPGIVPGSMGTASYIVRGLGNPGSFTSCAHGAGRRMGRREAARRLTAEGCREAMGEVVYGTGVSGMRTRGFGPGLDISEAPQAYKDIEEVMSCQADLVRPEVRLLPLGVLKG